MRRGTAVIFSSFYNTGEEAERFKQRFPEGMRQEFLIVRNTDPDEMSEPDEPLNKTGDVADVEVLFDGVFTQNEDRMGSQFALNT